MFFCFFYNRLRVVVLQLAAQKPVQLALLWKVRSKLQNFLSCAVFAHESVSSHPLLGNCDNHVYYFPVLTFFFLLKLWWMSKSLSLWLSRSTFEEDSEATRLFLALCWLRSFGKFTNIYNFAIFTDYCSISYNFRTKVIECLPRLPWTQRAQFLFFSLSMFGV